jgi:ABC-type nitrate/sulfonate/bicarbonate transport system ATPase subunit
MKQRAALARTLAAEGEIMLMDEPFGSVDSQTRHELQLLLIELWLEEEKTIIFVTHDIREAVFLSERIVLMKNEPGEIIEIVKNELPRPRRRSSEEFNLFFEQLQQRLHF